MRYKKIVPIFLAILLSQTSNAEVKIREVTRSSVIGDISSKGGNNLEAKGMVVTRTKENGLIVHEGPVDTSVGAESEVSGIMINRGKLSNHVNAEIGEGANSTLGSVEVE